LRTNFLSAGVQTGPRARLLVVTTLFPFVFVHLEANRYVAKLLVTYAIPESRFITVSVLKTP
jgi:hypothetical protein